MSKYSTVIIGGGASGICAAIAAAHRREPVLICEKTTSLGKKILATGNGRCNLLNDVLTDKFYNADARPLVRSIFNRFGKKDILTFFKELGLETISRDGRIFPVTNQAASVLKVLEIELRRLAVPVHYNFSCANLKPSKSGWQVISKDGEKIECRKVILTGGGKTYPETGSDGSTYNLACQLGHSLIEPVPSTVPLVVKDSLCHQLQGQRIPAVVHSVIDGKPGESVSGELLFTKYGLSGTCILDCSESISIALNRNHKTDVYVSVDLVPFITSESLKLELLKRLKRKLPSDEIMVGLLPNKFASALKALIENSIVDAAVDSIKSRRFKVSGTRGWNEAEFTCGGIRVDEIKESTLESRLHENLFFAGEILDVNGKRGGYNLAWAWASGYIAGQTGQ